MARYRRVRVLIVGHAAHALVPHQGAGVGQVLEDAASLTDEHSNRHTVNDVFASFERVRHARTCIVKRTFHEVGDVYEYASVGIGDAEAQLIKILETRFDWI